MLGLLESTKYPNDDVTMMTSQIGKREVVALTKLLPQCSKHPIEQRG